MELECVVCTNKISKKDYGYCADCSNLKIEILLNFPNKLNIYSSHKLKITYNVEMIKIFPNGSKTIYYPKKKFYPLVKKFSAEDFDEMGHVKSLKNPLLRIYDVGSEKHYNKSFPCYHLTYQIIGAKMVRVPDPNKNILE